VEQFDNQFEDQFDDQFEGYLRQQLRPVAEPAGFAARVLARVESEPAVPAKVIVMPTRRRVWMSGAVAAAVLVGGLLTQQAEVRHQRHQAEVAQQQFDSAIRITSETLDDTRQQLRDAGVEIGN
jgi:hypothetical protein